MILRSVFAWYSGATLYMARRHRLGNVAGENNCVGSPRRLSGTGSRRHVLPYRNLRGGPERSLYTSGGST